MSTWSASLVLAIFVGTTAAAATPVVYYSPGDDGGHAAVEPATVSGGTGVKIPIYIDGGPAPSAADPCESGDGDEVCAFNLVVNATGGASLANFIPASDIVFDLAATTLALNGGEFMSGAVGPTKLGDLFFDSVAVGTIELGTAQTVSADLKIVSLPPGVIAVVPEPDETITLALGCAGLAGLARLRVRRRTRA